MIKIPQSRYKPSVPYGRRGYMCLLIGIVTYVLLCVLIFVTVTPVRYELKVGDVAQQTITATKDIEDTITTERMRADAVNAVKLSYSRDDAVQVEVMAGISECFDSLDEARKRAETWLAQRMLPVPTPTAMPVMAGEGAIVAETPTTATPEPSPTPTATPEPTATPVPTKPSYTADFLDSVRQYLLLDLTDAQLEALFARTPAQFRQFREFTEATVRGVYENGNGITDGSESGEIAEIVTELSRPVYNIPRDMLEIARLIVTQYLKPNMFYNEEKTEEERTRVAEAIHPVMFKKGQNIVVQGEVITEVQVNLIGQLGLLKENRFDIELYGGLAGIILLLLVAFALYLMRFEPSFLVSPKKIILLGCILMLVLLTAWPLRYLNLYVIPVALGSMLVCLLLELRVAMVFNVLLSLLVGIVATDADGLLSLSMFNIFLTGLISGWVVTYSLDRWRGRSTIVLAGVFAGLANLMTMMTLGMMTNASMTTTFRNAGYSGLGGVLAAIMALGLSPLIEAIFSLATPSRLLELSNPNQPLLRRLLLEAPGTYHHSIIVGNLAEAAADAIGANTLLCRVGAYYHDVGKLVRPGYFKENQLSDNNPHDLLPPEKSAAILTSHTRDGYALAAAEKLPRVVLDLIVQHHGTTCAAYFLHRARELYGEVDEGVYRYEGPRPQTREAAIILMADTVEAATRSLKGHTYEKIEELTRKLIKGKMEDGQLDECPITMAQIEMVTNTFCSVLGGIYHERIEYPKSERVEGKETLKLESENGVAVAEGGGSAAEGAGPAAESGGSAVGNGVAVSEGGVSVEPAAGGES